MILSGRGFSFDINLKKYKENIRRYILKELVNDNKLNRALRKLYKLSLQGHSEAITIANDYIIKKISTLKAI